MDATDWITTTTDFCQKEEGADILFDRIVFNCLFPTSNGDVVGRTALIDKFFKSVGCWKNFGWSN